MSTLPHPIPAEAAVSNWALLVACPERDVDDHAFGAYRHPRNVGRVIRGTRCRTRKSLFQEWAAALQFPYYFGENWDAFEECLADLGWLRADRVVIYLTHADQALPKSAGDQATFLAILKTAAEERGETLPTGPRDATRPRLTIIFHVGPGRLRAFRRQLSGAGIEPILPATVAGDPLPIP